MYGTFSPSAKCCVERPRYALIGTVSEITPKRKVAQDMDEETPEYGKREKCREDRVQKRRVW